MSTDEGVSIGTHLGGVTKDHRGYKRKKKERKTFIPPRTPMSETGEGFFHIRPDLYDLLTKY